MDQKMLKQLRMWRAEQARLEGVEAYRVLPNAVLDALCLACPTNKEELLAIKGIKEAKYRKYGKALLHIMEKYSNTDISSHGQKSKQSQDSDSELFPASQKNISSALRNQLRNTEEETRAHASEAPESIMTVSQFLDGLNVELSGMAARIQGEVSSVDERERVVYFSLKDEKDESTVSCLIFRYQYDISGVKVAPGDKIIVEGFPEIYKPNGRMSFKAGVIELAGEGALKKAYEALKAKLEGEGLFAAERKRELPEFPDRIALITSKDGAAIDDFKMNLGLQGFRVDFYPTSVEGKKAVFEIIEALRYFNERAEKYDVLVLIRGGGSLESLQAFNNEALVREISQSKIPVLCGIGHEKDVSLATLVCDVAVSTPTATARTLREPWERAREAVLYTERHLLTSYEKILLSSRHQLEVFSHNLLAFLEQFAKRFQFLREQFLQEVPKVRFRLEKMQEDVHQCLSALLKNFSQSLQNVRENLETCEKTILRYDPRRALALGYSLIQKEGKILRSVEGVKKGDRLSLRLARGHLDSQVTGVYNE